MAKCNGKTTSREACKMPARKGERFCFTHSPATRAAQAAARKLGGYNRGTPHAGDPEQVHKSPRNIPEIFTILDYTLAETIAGENGVPRNRLLVSIAAAYVDALKVAEIETQLKELLRVLQARQN